MNGTQQLVRLDATGNVLWTRVYSAIGCNTVGTFDGTPYDIQFADVAAHPGGGGYVVVGSGIGELPHGDEQIMLRTDELGNAVWGRTDGNIMSDGNTCVTMSGGQLFVGGWQGDLNWGHNTLYRLDPNTGEMFGAYVTNVDPLFYPPVDRISRTADGGAVLCGSDLVGAAFIVKYNASFGVSWSGCWSDVGAGAVAGLPDGSVVFAEAAHVVRFNPSGAVDWCINLQAGNGTIRNMALRPDGRVLLASAHPDGYAWLAELNPAGAVTWAVRYGDPGDLYVPEQLHMMGDGSLRLVGTADVSPAKLLVIAVDSMGALGGCTFPAFAPAFSPASLTSLAPVYDGPGTVGEYMFALQGIPQNAYTAADQSCSSGSLVLQGQVFHDADLSGAWNIGEACFPYIMVHMAPENVSAMTMSDCQYHLLTAAVGSHTVTPVPLDPWWALSTDSALYTVQYNGGDSTITGLDFGYTPAFDTTVVSATLVTTPIICGGVFNQPVFGSIHVLNTGTTLPDVVVGITFDSLLSVTSSTPPPDSISGQTAYWHLNDIGYFTIAGVDLELGSDAWWGSDTLHSHGFLLDPTGVVDTLFSFDWSSPVLCAWDPNDKLVSPTGDGPHGLIPPETPWLTYTVRFQNTGTAAATNVIVQDQLSPFVDPTTLQILGTSHALTAVEGGSADLMVFRFDNIQLPDSGTDEPGSHGHLTYRVRPVPGLHHLDSIGNNAAIFFDQNPPVITNTAFNTILNCAETTWQAMIFDFGDGMLWANIDPDGNLVYSYQWLLSGIPIVGATLSWWEPVENGSYSVQMTDQYGCSQVSDAIVVIVTGVSADGGGNLRISPNPMTHVARVVMNEPFGSDARIELIDVNGRVLRSMNGNGTREVLIERGALECGMYLVLFAQEGRVSSARLLIQ